MSDTEVTTQVDYDARVARGVAFLDDHVESGLVPADWRERINTSTLRMLSPTQCVIGQIFNDKVGAYSTGWRYACAAFGKQDVHDRYGCLPDVVEDVELGFLVNDSDELELRAAWKRTLAAPTEDTEEVPQ